MYKYKIIFIVLMLVTFTFETNAQNFRIGWYSPLKYICGSDPIFDGTNDSPNGSFKSIGINTLLTYDHQIYEKYNGTGAFPYDLTTLINNTYSYLDSFPNQQIILDISAGKESLNGSGGTYIDVLFRSNNDVIQYISNFFDEPQVIGWYIADEPEGSWANDFSNPTYFSRDALVARYTLVKSLSTKDVFVATSNAISLRNKYGDGTIAADGKPRVAQFYDIMMADQYPVAIGHNWSDINVCRTISQQTDSLVKYDANTTKDIFYFIAQGQGWNEPPTFPNCLAESYNMDDFTMHQLRYMVISPMIWYAKGILFWSYANASRRGNNSDPADSWITVHRFTQWFNSSSFYGNLGNIYGTNRELNPPSNDGNWIHFRTKTYDSTSTYREYFILSVNENPVYDSTNHTSGYVAVPPVPSGWFNVAEELQYDANNPIQTYDVVHTISADSRIYTTWYSFEVKIFRLKYFNLAKINTPEPLIIETPKSFKLYNNYPNPFNPTTQIRYDLPQESFVSLAIYDMMGHKVKELVNKINQAGSYVVPWDGTDESGNFVSSGTYLLKMGKHPAVYTLNGIFLLLNFKQPLGWAGSFQAAVQRGL